jgi:hypothetical protein
MSEIRVHHGHQLPDGLPSPDVYFTLGTDGCDSYGWRRGWPQSFPGPSMTWTPKGGTALAGKPRSLGPESIPLPAPPPPPQPKAGTFLHGT